MNILFLDLNLKAFSYLSFPHIALCCWITFFLIFIYERVSHVTIYFIKSFSACLWRWWSYVQLPSAWYWWNRLVGFLMLNYFFSLETNTIRSLYIFPLRHYLIFLLVFQYFFLLKYYKDFFFCLLWGLHRSLKSLVFTVILAIKFQYTSSKHY